MLIFIDYMFLLSTQFLNYILKLSLVFCYHFKYFQQEIIKKKIQLQILTSSTAFKSHV